MASISAPAEFTLVRQPTVRTRGPVRWIWSHARRYWVILVIMVIGAVGNAALAALVPVLVGNAFNSMLLASPVVSALIPLAFILGGSQIVRGVLQFGRNFGAELVAQRMERDIRDEMYVSLLGKSMTFHNLQPVGDTMARATNDVREVNLMFSPGINLVIGSGMFMVIPFFVVPRYHPALLLTPALFVIAYFVSLWFYLKEMSPVTDQVRETFGAMNTHLSEALDGVEVMKGAAQEGAETETFITNARRVRHFFVQQGDIEARFLPMLWLGLAYAGGLFHALLLFRQGLLDTGGVVAYFGLLRMLEFPTFTSSFAYTQISSGLSGARRILELINHETNLDQNAAGRSGAMRGEIEFRDVTFRYPSGGMLGAAVQEVRDGGTGRAGAEERVVSRQTGTDRGDRRADRRRQDQPGAADQPHLRCGPGAGAGGRGGCARMEPGLAAQPDLDDRAGHLPVLALDQRQHRLRAAGQARGRRCWRRRRRPRRMSLWRPWARATRP